MHDTQMCMIDRYRASEHARGEGANARRVQAPGSRAVGGGGGPDMVRWRARGARQGSHRAVVENEKAGAVNTVAVVFGAVVGVVGGGEMLRVATNLQDKG